jgi:RHS repeat-associated protein
MIDPSGVTAYLYDAVGELTNQVVAYTNGPTLALSYAYSTNGSLTGLWTGSANGVTNSYQYDLLGRLTNVVANGTEAAGYGFDAVGNLQSMVYGNNVTNLYQYDSMNRLVNLAWKLHSAPLASFAYTVGPAGNRTGLTETVNGAPAQTYAWTYDPLYRLTQEALSGGKAGTANYTYDAVGNRLGRSAATFGPGGQTATFTANDGLAGDSYDNNGNTTLSTGTSYQYDALDHLTNVNSGAIIIGYDGDGNRVKKTVGGTTTYYLVDDRNPSGYAQVVEEWTTASSTTNLSRLYNYGLDLISQQQMPGGTISYYGTDGHGSTRFLANTSGVITDTYTYDAYGNLIASTGSTPNNYLYCGQQWDSDLGFYYNRARYLNPNTGRFWTLDTHEGDNTDPLSLHKYLYCQGNPIDGIDPKGHDDMVDMLCSMAINSTLQSMAMPVISSAVSTVGGQALSACIPQNVEQGLETLSPDAIELGVSGSVSGPLGKTPFGFTSGGGFEVLWSPHSTAIAAYDFGGGGVTFGKTGLAPSGQGTFGAVYSCPNSMDYSGEFITVSIPYATLPKMAQNKINGILGNSAGYVANVLGGTVNSDGEVTSIAHAIPVAGILNKTSINVFWCRYGGSFGFSVGYGLAPKIATSNVSVTWTWYKQLYPEGGRATAF